MRNRSTIEFLGLWEKFSNPEFKPLEFEGFRNEADSYDMFLDSSNTPDQKTAKLQPHSSRPYNPIIANAFFRAGEIEAWGRGIQQIVDACREAGAPEPTFDYVSGDLWIEFPYSTKYLKAFTESAEENSAARGE
jgi:hypothetical protein